jgi:hypothetical protein
MREALRALHGTARDVGVVVPCHVPYLPKLLQLLASMEEHVLDAAAVHVFVIGSKREQRQMEGALAGRTPPGMVLSYVPVEELLGFDTVLLPPTWLAANMQALKKFAGLWLLPFRTALLLDADSLFVRPLCLANHLAAAGSILHYDAHVQRPNKTQRHVLHVTATLLGIRPDMAVWAGMVVFDQWVIDKRAVVEMAAKVVSTSRYAVRTAEGDARVQFVQALVRARPT